VKDILGYVRCANLPRGTKSFEHQQKKKATRNGDDAKLDKLQTGMKIPSVRNVTIWNENFTTKNKIHIPDLFIAKKIILEHDTFKIHGELNAPNERTRQRNSDYFKAGLPFFVIHEDLARMLKLDEVALATYLFYHIEMLELAKR
jgi:hypothetical protein